MRAKAFMASGQLKGKAV